MDHRKNIIDALKKNALVFEAMQQQVAEIEAIAEVLISAYQKGKKMVLFGNGGSAADCQHWAAELVGTFADRSRRSLPALALTTDTSALTAIGNDFGYDNLFSRQVESLVNVGDVVMAISTSGNSPNVIKGAIASKKRGATVVGLTGQAGGKLEEVCDMTFHAPSKETPHIQEAHMAVGHILCSLLDKAFSETN